MDISRLASIVKEASKIMLSAVQAESSITAKEGRQNFVTKYDVEVQDHLQKALKEFCPGAGFVGEESKAENGQHGLRFIVDPIDGTTNFMQGYDHSAVSVALCDGAEVLMGVVYNPYADEIFTAVKGEGSFLNGKRIHVSDRELSDGLALVGTSPYHSENSDYTFELIRKVFDNCRDIRRSGSAAIDICQIACGRCELFFEQALQPWDYAAGYLILTEAGGIAKTFDGNKPSLDHGCDIYFCNPESETRFLELV